VQSYLCGVFESLRNPNYRWFFSGQLISMTGTWMQQVAMSWLLYRMTGSAALLGSITFLGQVPVTLLSPFGGAFADRHNRRTILMYTQTLAMLVAIILAVLTFGHWVQLWQLFVLSIILGIVSAFDIPARQAFVSDMVDKENLLNAIALNASIFHGSRVIGPAVAGLLVAAVGESWCFALNALSFLAVLGGLQMMKLQIVTQIKAGSAWESVKEGIHFAFTHPQIRMLMLMVAFTSFFAMPYTVLMPIIADRILHGGSQTMGILMGLSGVGSVVGALRLAAMKPQGERAYLWVGGAAMGFGLSLVLFSFAKVWWLSGLLLIPAGFCMVSQMATSNTLVQTLAPNKLRGRVMAVFGMMFMGIMPFGALLAGYVADAIGASHTILMEGCITTLAGAWFLWNRRVKN